MAKIASDIGDGASRAVEFTGEVINDLCNVVLQTVSGIVDGANLIANTTGDVADKLAGNVLGVQATQIFKGAGETAGEIANGLGTIVAEVPLIGKPAALVVQRASDGVYHVIASVGSIAGSSAQRVGKIAHKATDLVVFTLSSTRDEIEEIGQKVKELVTKLTARRTKKGGRRSRRHRAVRKGSRSRRRSKRRGGLDLRAPNMDDGPPFHPQWAGGLQKKRRTARR